MTDYSAFDLDGPAHKQATEETRAAIADGLLAKMGLSHSEQNGRGETIQVIEQWHGNDMIRYIEHKDGTRTILEHHTDAARPFVKINLNYPVPYIGRALSVSERIRTKPDGHRGARTD